MGRESYTSAMDALDLLHHLPRILGTLELREEKVARMKVGLGGPVSSDAEIAAKLGVSEDEVRAIFARVVELIRVKVAGN